MNAVAVAVVTLGEHNPVEWFVELQEDFHAALLAFDVQRNDLGGVSNGQGPQFVRG